MAIYEIVKFFIERGSQVIEMVNAFIDAVAAIASGAISGAATLVENALAKALPVVIGFLASLLGISGLAKKVQKLIMRIRKKIDKAIDKLIMKAKKAARKLLQKLQAGKDGPDERTEREKRADLENALDEAEQVLKAGGATPESVREKLPSIRSKYRLTSLQLERVKEGKYQVKGKINPGDKTDEVKLEQEQEGDRRVLKAFHGANGDKLLKIINSETMVPNQEQIFLGGNPQSLFMHGADVSRKQSYVVEVELTFDPKKVTQQARWTPGVPDTKLLETSESISAKILKLFVRKGQREEGFEFDQRVGVENIKGYLETGWQEGASTDQATTTLNLRPPAQRHFVRKVTQRTVAKDKNTVIASGVDIAGDVAAINAGRVPREGNTFTLSSRTYGVENNTTLFPISGPGLQLLDRGAFKALGVYNKFGDTPRAAEILDNMGISIEQRATALSVWRVG